MTEHLIRRVNASEIVRAQKADPETDVFTGISFEVPEEIVWTMDSLKAFIATLPAEESAKYSAQNLNFVMDNILRILKK